MKASKDPLVWLPLAISIAIIGGMFIGDIFSGKQYVVDYDRKLNTILNLVADDYVDTVKINDLVEQAVPDCWTVLTHLRFIFLQRSVRLSTPSLKVASAA